MLTAIILNTIKDNRSADIRVRRFGNFNRFIYNYNILYLYIHILFSQCKYLILRDTQFRMFFFYEAHNNIIRQM